MGHFDPYSDFKRKKRSGISKKAGSWSYRCRSMFKKSFFKKISSIFLNMRKTSEALIMFINC